VSLMQPSYTHTSPVSPNTMVIFGAGGDLTRRKLVPALLHLCNAASAAEQLCGTRARPFEDGRRRLPGIDGRVDPGARRHRSRPFGQAADGAPLLHADHIHDDDAHERLRAHLSELDIRCGAEGNYLFYLAIPPSLFAPVTGFLGTGDLLWEPEHSWRRIVPERRHFLRNPKWGPSDWGPSDFGFRKKSGDGHGLRRPTFVLRPSRRALRVAPGLPQGLDAVSHGLAFRLRRRSRAALRQNARPYGYAGVVALRSSLTLPRFPVLLHREAFRAGSGIREGAQPRATPSPGRKETVQNIPALRWSPVSPERPLRNAR